MQAHRESMQRSLEKSETVQGDKDKEPVGEKETGSEVAADGDDTGRIDVALPSKRKWQPDVFESIRTVQVGSWTLLLSLQMPDEDANLVNVCVYKDKKSNKNRPAVECVFPLCADRGELVCSKRYI